MTAGKWSIPLDELVRRAEGKVDKVVRKVTLDVFKSVVEKSPVDTGRFRANWNVSAVAPDATTTEDVDQARSLSRIDRVVATAPLGGIVYLTNGLPYARRLEYGYSKQAPNGMVRLTIENYVAFVKKAIADSRT